MHTASGRQYSGSGRHPKIFCRVALHVAPTTRIDFVEDSIDSAGLAAIALDAEVSSKMLAQAVTVAARTIMLFSSYRKYLIPTNLRSVNLIHRHLVTVESIHPLSCAQMAGKP